MTSAETGLDTALETGADTVQNNPSPKGLLRLVYIMGIVLVLLFLALIGGLIWKSSQNKSVVAVSTSVDLGLAGAVVRSTQLDNGQLLVTTDTEIIVVDVAKRKVILRSAVK
jgi:cell division septal protein FtsQ